MSNGTGYIFLIVFLPRIGGNRRAETGIRATSRSRLTDSTESLGLVETGEGFSGIVRSCMMASLENILGKPAIGALVLHFKLDQLANNPSQLHETLARVFGNGAAVLEKIILKELYRRLDLVLGDTAFSFSFDRLVLEAKDALKGSRSLS